MTRTLLVYLHGKGADPSAHHELIQKIADKYGAELLALKAPFPHKDGFMWFGKTGRAGQRRIIAEQFNQSVENIISQVEEKLHCRECQWDNVILCGHSQGGVMALHLGLTMSPSRVISLCGDFPPEITYSAAIDKKVPLFWIEGGKDTFLTPERKNSWQKLKDWGCNLQFRRSPHSSHNHLYTEIIDLIE